MKSRNTKKQLILEYLSLTTVDKISPGDLLAIEKLILDNIKLEAQLLETANKYVKLRGQVEKLLNSYVKEKK